MYNRFFIALWAIIGLIVLFFDCKAQPAGYAYGKRITISSAEVSGGSSLTSFPVMIRFQGATADNDLRTTANGGHVESATGYDIVFTSDEAGTILLDHQIEYYDGAAGEYVAWVRIPSLSNSTDTDIYIYYGNCSIAGDPSTTDVWNTDFDAVYNLHDDFNDATVNVNTGTNTGSTDASPALIGDGQTFGPTLDNDRVEVPTASLLASQGTVSAWVNTSSFSANHQYIFGHTTVSAFNDRIQLYTNDATGLLDLGLGDDHNLDVNFFDMDPSQWYYVVLTYDGTNYVVYVDGTSATSGTYTGLTALHSFADIGNDGLATARNEAWVGDIDHVRLSNEVFGASWIQTEYNNQRDGSTFYTISAELPGTTYYSLATGAWDDNNSWSLSSDGSSGAVGVGEWPSRNDNVVIQNGHTITIDATDDNGSCGISADGLGRSNVGNGADPFTGSADPMFYHTGDVLISNGGTLICSEELMLEGYTLVENGGTLTMTEDIINLGYLEISTTATLTTNDDLILTGNSITIIDNTSTGTDDLYIEWTDATLCGEGAYSLGGGAGSTIQYFNTATDAQICEELTVECPTMDCTGVPATGTGGFISGNVGPGGVGDQDSNELWLRADDLNLSDGASVTTWTDASGNGLTATASGGAGTEPTFNTNDINTSLPSISFDGGDFLNLGSANLNYTPGTDSWSFFLVFNVQGATPQGTFFSKATSGTRHYQYTIDDNAGTSRFTAFIGGNSDVGSITSTGAWFVSSHTNNATQKDSWTNEGVNFAAQGVGTDQVPTADVLIGARRDTGPTTGTGFLLTGSIAEIAMYDSEATEAQRIIITNYLAAKYNISLTANDVYDMDENLNGDFDFEVAGIGQASDGTNHLDAIGGVVRMWNPTALDNNEFLMWGHDNTSFPNTTTSLSDVDGTVIQERLVRVWRVSESADVGTVSISIDFNATGENPLGNNLRLMIDRDNDFSTNDVTLISGSVSGNIAVFSGVDFQDGDRFTLGNTDASVPLPIELISFTASPNDEGVSLKWITGSEENNDYFTIERSRDTKEWKEVLRHSGAGTTENRQEYEAIDGEPLIGASYYRLKQTDYDGQFSYSDIVYLNHAGTDQLKVMPNPSHGIFRVSGLESTAHRIEVYNLLGERIDAKITYINSVTILDLRAHPAGVYLLKSVNGPVRLLKN